MKTQSEINQLMLEFEIREEMESSFKSLLEHLEGTQDRSILFFSKASTFVFARIL